MNLYVLLGGVALAVALFMGGLKVGMTVEENTAIRADLKRADRVLVQQRVVIEKVPVIVTKVVTREVQVEKEVERVVTVANDLLAPDCVLPDRYGMLLVAAANGVDPASGGADAFAGEYGCREVLAATLKDLSAGWRNTARLGGLQEAARVVIEARGAE